MTGSTTVYTARGTTPVSALILALNEEDLIGRCIRSVAWADEVVVIDSGSTDRTMEIAAALGARVVQQPWLGFAAQRTFATTCAKHDWALFLDADEVLTHELARSVTTAMRKLPDPRDGFAFDRRTEWFGQLLPNSQRRSMIRSFVRLFHREHGGYDSSMVVHERVRVPGRRRLLAGNLIQWRPETLAERTSRAARYAELEAELAEDYHGSRASVRRATLLPAVRLAWILVGRRNVVLGTPGVIHALHKANGEWMRQLTLFERQVTPVAGSTVADVMREQNAAPPDATRYRARIWTAVPALGWLSLRYSLSGRHDAPTLLEAFATWNARWLRAAKAWESSHVVMRPHPPGFDHPKQDLG